MLDFNSKTISKKALIENFSKHYKEYYTTKLFDDEGFKRHRCNICGRYFWSIEDRQTCSDPSHTEYSFIKEKPLNEDYVDFWKKFEKFFRANGHAIVNRYPVVSRWRPDLYFTIAGIQDFQRIENGMMTFEYSANPLLVPQMCLRFRDVANVGITGRHFSCFMMANQTAFNWPHGGGYWRDHTIKLNFDFLTKVIGVKKEEILYHEEAWAMPDFSGFGASMESFARGNEFCNNVFTQFELVNNSVRELKTKVVDVGWGLEHLLWFYTGKGNVYEAAFPRSLAAMKKHFGLELDEALYSKFTRFAGGLDVEEVREYRKQEDKVLERTGISRKSYEANVKPVQAVYAILDHVHTLLFAITDGALPSNMGGGYNLRVVGRRCFDFIRKYKLELKLADVARMISNELERLYPELKQGLDTFDKVMELEERRYLRSVESGKRTVQVLLQKKGDITNSDLKVLYESNGVTPEVVAEVAKEKGVKFEVSEDFYADMMKSDIVKKEKEERKIDIEIPNGVKDTKKLYYDFVTSADAKVLFAKGKYFILNQTPFYPESGGQVQDTGTVNGIKVVDVQKIGEIVIHVAERETKFKKGDKVTAIVDEERRKAIIAHHTATHLISSACRHILGPHAWQEGSKKEPHKAHLDIVHYDKLSGEDVKKIEDLVNSWLINGIRVSAHEMKRGEAESKYGFTIYQGHGAPSKIMRIVTIKALGDDLIDAEACGGLHAIGKESYVGMVKIIGTYRIHDGVDRIEFVAGPALLRLFQEEHAQTELLSARLNAEPGLVGKRVEELLAENSSMHKQIEKSSELVATSTATSIEDAKFIDKELDFDRKTLIRIADLLTKRNENSVAMLRNREGYVVCIAGDASEKSAIDVLNEKLKGQFSGGGSKRFAEGKIKKV